MNETIPNLLSIAGSDPSGGAGIQADLKTFSAFKTYGMAVITGLTAQNTKGVSGIELPPASFVGDQLRAVLDDIQVSAIKIGMLGNAEVISVVSDILRDRYDGPIVLDPVMVAKSGDALLQPDAVDALRQLLVPLATVVTPNLPEADVLTGQSTRSQYEMIAAAQALLAMGPKAVMLKGGHLDSDSSPDFLLTHDEREWLNADRLATRNTHGTGCTLSSAIAASLGHGIDAMEACRRGKRYITAAIAAADRLSVGEGVGPTHHFHELWHSQ